MNDNMRDYIVTLGITTGRDAEGRPVTAQCAPIMLRAYSTEHVREKILSAIPASAGFSYSVEPRRDKRKTLSGKPVSQRSHMLKPVNTTTAPTLRVANMEDLAGV